MTAVRQFDTDDINDMGDDGYGPRYWFECAMVSACEPLLDSCEDNHDVEERLRKARVIQSQDETDSEMCALVVRFKTEAQGAAFIARLNSYLVEKAKRLRDANNF